MTRKDLFPASLVGSIFLLGAFLFLQIFFAPEPALVDAAGSSVTASSTVTVGNSVPTVTSVVLNALGAITLTANATTAVNVNATITDTNGCGDITGAAASATILIYRSGITSSTCRTTQSSSSCYYLAIFTASSTCAANAVNTTTTFRVQYFAEPTTASSSYAAQTWIATVIFQDINNSTGTGDAVGQELNVLTAIEVATSSINYGSVSAGADTGATNQSATSTNAGNSSTTVQVKANATLTSGANSIATSSQEYVSSTFTFGAGVDLTESLVTISGAFMTSPTGTSNVFQRSFWGLGVPGGTASGTYTGQTQFSSLFQP